MSFLGGLLYGSLILALNFILTDSTTLLIMVIIIISLVVGIPIFVRLMHMMDCYRAAVHHMANSKVRKVKR